MKKIANRYVAVVLAEDGAPFLATVPDLGSCFATGDTVEAVKASLPDALALHVEGLMQDGQSLPPPRSRHEVLKTVGQPVVADYLIEIQSSARNRDL